MTEEQKDGITEEFRRIKPEPEAERFSLVVIVDQVTLDMFRKVRKSGPGAGPDFVCLVGPDRKIDEGSCADFLTTLAPGASGCLHCIIGGKLIELSLREFQREDWPRQEGQTAAWTRWPYREGMERWTGEWPEFVARVAARNTLLGFVIETKGLPVHGGDFTVAAGFVPMHRLAERHRSGLPLFPEERRQFFDLRTPLNWAVGLALFSVTSEDVPEGWQEVTVADLEDRVFCLTERDTPRRGDHRTDILAEVVKLHSTKNAYVRYDWERRGRAWRRTASLGSDYAIPNLEFVFLDKKGRRVLPSDPAIQSEVVPLEVKGRRTYTPDGKDIKALPKDRYKLERIRWRWNPSFADDLRASPALDAKGNIKKDSQGKVLRGGFNIKVAARIFDALYRLRTERAYLTHDLLILLAHDIYKPPKQNTAAGRNVIEREAQRLYDLLGIEDDPKHPDRAEERVAHAIARLMQPDIGALLPTSTTTPRPPSEAELASGRRKSPFYRLFRAETYTPKAALVTKEEAAVIEAEYAEDIAHAQSPVPSGPKTYQVVLPYLGLPPAPPIPSGSDIRAARQAAGMNLRDFAKAMKGPSFKTWSLIETGKRTEWSGRILPEVWERVRDFIAQHGPGADSDGGKRDA